MDIELLRTFLEVRNTRHFGKAAENLYLTQAAVSARIKQLETIIGAPLFTRFRNNLQLTVTGERLINHAETILIAWERARLDVSIKKRQKHIFSLGSSGSLWDLVLPKTIVHFHESMPDTPLRTETHEPDVLVRHVMERSLDLALIYEPAKMSDLVSIPLAPIKLIMVSHLREQNAYDIMQKDFVGVDWGQHIQVQLSQQFPDAASPMLQCSQAKIAREFMIKFGGSAYLPPELIARDLGKTLFKVEDAPVFERPIYACHHRDNLYLHKIEACIELLRIQHSS